MSRRRQFGSIRTLPSGQYQARYRDNLGGRPSKVFRTKGEANAWLAEQLVDLQRGTWIDPKAGEITFAVYAAGWLRDRRLAPRTRELYEGHLRLHLGPTFGPLPLVRITPEAVRRWHGTVGRTNTPPPVTAAMSYRLLRAILNTAVDDGRISKNPCRIKGAGSVRSKERPVATIEQVYAIADAVRPRWRLMVLLGTFTSIRLGEALDLQRRDLDLHQGVLQVDLQLQELKSGKRIVREPKGGGEREIAIPPHLNDEITEHLERWVGPTKSAYVFTGEKGGPVRRNFFNADWRKRVDALDLGLGNFHFHDLRHTGNTLAAATGASTKELMSRMGHSSSRAALIYQHATRDRDKFIAQALSDMVTKAGTGTARSTGRVSGS
jgi:integrase